MNYRILMGNGLSAVGNCFTVAGSWSRDYKRIYLYQAVQCLTLALANLFFGSISGTTTLLLCAARNTLSAYHKFTGKLCAVFLVLIVAAGIASNNRGWIGLIPVAATFIYTIFCCLLKKTIAIKCNMILNLILWAIYDVVIMDFVSCTVDSISVVAAVISIGKMRRKKEKEQINMRV